MAWYDKLLGGIGLERKSYKLEEKPTRLAHGASWSNAYGNKPAYSQLGSLAVFAQHPYVFAALSRLSQDLAATPIKLIKGKGKNAVVIEEHPVINLFDQPSTSQDKFSFLEQIIIDLTACGNCYILLLGLNDQPDSIVRLHPEQVEILTDNLGVAAYRYTAEGEQVDYPPERVIHGKNASWATGIQGLYGVGCIQPIAEEVMADLNVNRLVSESSAKGRPDVILSPANDLDIWDSETRRQILEQYNGLATNGGGCLVTSGMVNVTFTQLTPRDVEYQAARQYSKSAITAALGVPASVLGDDSANFATSRQQSISYWTTLSKRGKRIGHLLTLIARRWDSDLKVEFDYSGVEALNSMRSDQIQRATSHILNGFDPSEAYAYEGLEDAPIIAPDQREPEAEDIGDEEDQSARSFFLSLIDEESTEDFDIVIKGSVGDKDPTNFPEDMDNKKVSLKNSNHSLFDHEYAENLKLNYPRIWKAGGNIEGGNQFRRLYPIAQRDNTEAKTETEEMAIRKREAWIARHYEDGKQFEDGDLSITVSNVGGIVAQIKWLAVGALGQAKMKSVINELKIKLDEKAAFNRRRKWDLWVKARQEPAEKMLKNAADRYLEQASKRYEKRIKKFLTVKANQPIQILDLSELLSITEERKEIFNTIGGTWQKVWALTGSAELDNVFRLARQTKPIDVQFSSRDLMFENIEEMTNELSKTTADTIENIVKKGMTEGLTITDIAERVKTSRSFSKSRSIMIARTESTKAANRAAVAAYNEANDLGIEVMKEWLSSQDGNVRDSHMDLDGTVIGVNEEFEADGAFGLGPGSFGVASEDINCRCTLIPLVK